MNDPHLADLPSTDTRQNARPESYDGNHAEQGADLERLAAELRPSGCKTVLVTGERRPPFLDVLCPEYPGALAARVRAQADYFWWPWGELIAGRDQLTTTTTTTTTTTAAAVIAGALHPNGRRP